METEVRTEVFTLEGQFQFYGKSWGIIREKCLPSPPNITLVPGACTIALNIKTNLADNADDKDLMPHAMKTQNQNCHWQNIMYQLIDCA